MERSAQSGASEAGQEVDESAVAPKAKSYESPLRPADEVRLRMGVSRDHISLDWKLTIVKEMRAAADFLVVATVSLAAAGGAVSLCRWWHATGLSAFMIGGGAGAVIFGVGLAFVLPRRPHN